MITVTEKTERTLSSSDEIAAYLRERFAAMQAGASFKAGETVVVSSRAGMPPDLAVGDVAVVVATMQGQPFTHVLVLHASGAEMVVQVPTANLAKRDAT